MRTRSQARKAQAARSGNFFLRGGDDIFRHMVEFMDTQTLQELSMCSRALRIAVHALSPKSAVETYLRDLELLHQRIAETEPIEDVTQVFAGVYDDHYACKVRDSSGPYRKMFHFTVSRCPSEQQLAECLTQALDNHDADGIPLYFLVAFIAATMGMQLLLFRLQHQLMFCHENMAKEIDAYFDAGDWGDSGVMLDNPLAAFLKGQVLGEKLYTGKLMDSEQVMSKWVQATSH